MSLQGILAKRAAEARSGEVNKPLPTDPAASSETGPGLEDPTKDPVSMKETKKEPAAGSYLALDLRQFFLASGFKIIPVDGVYAVENYNESQRKEILALLEYYATLYNLVELV